MTYATLKADIATWARRSDLTSAIPSFVSLAEMEIYRTHATPLRVLEMEEEVTLTVTSQVATLPADFLDARYIKLDNSSKTTIFYIPPDAWTPSCGKFTIVASEVRLPTGLTGNLKLVYFAQPEKLSSDADTNDVLENYYGAYLSASLKYAAAYVKDANAVSFYQAQLDTFLDGADRHGKSLTAGPLVVRVA